MTQYIYVMKGLTKHVNGRQILKETWLSFLPNAKIGIIGPNGAGKSTILKIMAGIDKEYNGETWAMQGIKIGYLAQEPTLNKDKNVYENILEGLKEKTDLLDKFNEISNKFAFPLEEEEMNNLLMIQAELQEKIDIVDAWNLDHEIEIAMTALGCPSKNLDVTKISGGEKRRVALCRLLLEKPDLLLLDEPTNHLDTESIDWLEHYLKNYNGTVVIVTHDRYFLDNITKWILEIDRGQCVPWESNYSTWLDQKRQKLLQESKDDKSKCKQLEKELEWVKQNPKARQAKSKARITAYNELLNQQHQKVSINTATIIIPQGPRLGNLVIEFDNVSKNFGSKALLSNFSCKIPPGAIVGIIGANGAGKTTLFKMILGQEKIDSGIINIGSSVKFGYVDQSRDHLNDKNNVWEEISSGVDEIELGNKTIKSRAYCAAFNFRGPDQQKLVGQLSGGERNRIHIAKLLKQSFNVVLLDEPSNDLDVDTLRALEDAILEFNGCVLVISHDRWFLDRIATHIISFEKDNTTWFEGNYQDYHNYVANVLGKNVIDTKGRYRKFSS